MSKNLGRKGKHRETIAWTCAQNLCSSSNRTGQSIRTTTLLRHRTSKNTTFNKIPMFFVSPFWHSQYSTNNGPTSCIPLAHRRNQIPVCQHRTGLFWPVLYWRKTRQYRQILWTYFYMPRYGSSPFGNMSRFKYRHLPQCISTVHLPEMPTWKTITSDNGKTFVGASEELKKSVKALDKDKIYKVEAAVKTTWKFNPPYGPHFGGV